MDLRHMRHFVAVAEELHFGRAAQRLNMTQPPVSQSIQRLEEGLGISLLNRTRSGVKLTDAGKVFLDEARRTLMQADLASKLTRRAAISVDEIRVAFVGPALYRLVPQVVRSFRELEPDVAVRLFESPSPGQVPGLLAGDYDIGFMLSETEGSEIFGSIPVERVPFVAAVPSDWPIAGNASVTLEEIAQLPFIRPPSKYLKNTKDVLSIFHDLGVVPNVVQEATQTNTTLALVSAGIGCTLAPATAALTQPPRVRFIEISDHPANRHFELKLAWVPDNVGPTIKAFIEAVTVHVAKSPGLLNPDEFAV